MSVEGEAVKIVANSVAPDMRRLGDKIFGCGVRRVLPSNEIENRGAGRALIGRIKVGNGMAIHQPTAHEILHRPAARRTNRVRKSPSLKPAAKLRKAELSPGRDK
jgi:hypothetical protein